MGIEQVWQRYTDHSPKLLEELRFLHNRINKLGRVLQLEGLPGPTGPIGETGPAGPPGPEGPAGGETYPRVVVWSQVVEFHWWYVWENLRIIPEIQPGIMFRMLDCNIWLLAYNQLGNGCAWAGSQCHFRVRARGNMGQWVDGYQGPTYPDGYAPAAPNFWWWQWAESSAHSTDDNPWYEGDVYNPQLWFVTSGDGEPEDHWVQLEVYVEAYGDPAYPEPCYWPCPDTCYLAIVWGHTLMDWAPSNGAIFLEECSVPPED